MVALWDNGHGWVRACSILLAALLLIAFLSKFQMVTKLPHVECSLEANKTHCIKIRQL